VFAFDARHFHHLVETFGHSEFFSEFRRVHIFLHVAAFESAREIHQEKPAGNEARRADGFADCPENFFSRFIRLCAEFFEPARDVFAVFPFFRFYLFNLLALRRILYSRISNVLDKQKPPPIRLRARFAKCGSDFGARLSLSYQAATV
jgi:hypothetical protein